MRKIELLAPAGDWDCLRAAVANGADAVYFGVDKYNARVRAKNFRMEELNDVMAYLHKYNVRGYVTFNILVFENELKEAKQLVEACIDAGVDALIVQDLGLVKLIRDLSPDFPIHGSTQMTVTSPEAVEFLKPYNLEVVVLGRENNLTHIQKIAEKTNVPLEVFVHGALCVSYSGQCLTSEMWGGRSANRGECAQACRLPYDLIVDGEQKEMGNIAYLLSPKDLAALDLVPELIEAGVSTFKIEGRLKSPEYVANVVSKYRKAIDEYLAGRYYNPSKEEIRELQQSFSRGFTHGFLKGTNNKQLVDGTFPKSRGVFLGTVKKVLKDGVLCELEAPLKRGDGIVFDAGRPEEKEEGGRVYDLRKHGKKVEGEVEKGLVEIVPGRHDVNLTRVRVGDRIWKTSDQELDRRLRKTFEIERPYQLFPLTVHVYGEARKPLISTWRDETTGNEVIIQSEQMLDVAQKRPLTLDFIKEQFGRLGGTIFELQDVYMHMADNVILPVKELNRIRRQAVEQLIEKRQRPRLYIKQAVDVTSSYRQKQRAENSSLMALCRTLEQVEAACDTDVDMVYADFEFTTDYPKAVQIARAMNKPIALATPRIHMPGENGILRGILKAEPDAILVRSLGAVQYYTSQLVEQTLIGDFSLNISNHLAAQLFLSRGLDRITPSYDLNIQQMIDLLEAAPTEHMEIVIHQHLPMFHTEHCVYCTFLSEGTDFTNCGRPCEKHRVSLRDRIGMLHPVRVDIGCRNTVYNAIEQSGAEYIPHFLSLGVRSYRVEFLEESPKKVEEVITLYREALEGKRSGTSVWRTLKAINQLGVTRGQLIKK
ncbi:collagenase-like protease [Anoxybacillus flavithermus]|uniref:Collagenase-like protease n=1 Tax=Anoxybacillus flavithermus TaxID=33934 RepID=A0A2G5RR37_9BACL|nr:MULTISPECIES: U32 family peptidase [Anoxybacillus]KFZ42111.1 peptidase U32 [Anoxybacillus sp. KU2-6(11)]PIC05160.1 collagenase-like protease [Anoxybacillus flavithermus]